MATAQRIHPSFHGRVFYDRNRGPYEAGDYFRGRRQRPHVLRVAHAADEFCQEFSKSHRHGLSHNKKSGDPAKRLIRLVAPFKNSKVKRSTNALPKEKEPSRTQPSGSTAPQPQSVAVGSIVTERNNSSSTTATTTTSSSSPPSYEDMRMATASPRGSVSGSSMLHLSSLTDASRSDSTALSRSGSNVGPDIHGFSGTKPVATGNGVSVFVTMAEPVIYLSGFENHDPSTRSTAMLRGNMLLRVSKTAKIKTVSMKFKGRAETDWPEGIPPKRTDFKDTYNIIDHTFSFYDCNMGDSEHHGAHTFIPVKGPGAPEHDAPTTSHAFEQFRKSGVFETITSSGKERRHSLQNNISFKSTGKGDIGGPTPATKGYRTFTPGDYIYNFELPIDSRYPETIDVELGYVKYELEAMVERAGAFRANLVGSREVQLVRAPSGESLESVEPIAISRDWEDQLHYDIVISGKSFPLGTQVPIAFKLTPLAKVQCHRVKVFITENIQYFTKDKKVHRMEPTRKLQLFEKRADSPSNSTYPGSSIKIISGGGVSYDDRDRAAHGEENIRRDNTNLLGRLEDEYNVGPTEMELNVQLPSCFNMPEKDKNQRIHFDTTYSNIQVHHWIKIVMRLSKADPENPGKRRHFEISIDSPLNILSCRATQKNTALPSYTRQDFSGLSVDQSVCGCPNAPLSPASRRAGGISLGHANSNSSRSSPAASSADLGAGIAPPPAAHFAGGSQPHPSSPTGSSTSSTTDLSTTGSGSSGSSGDSYDASRDTQRPMHLLRQPSFNPPSFDESEPPPPLVTPPPQYESLVGPGDDPDRGLADYFQRLADEIDDSDDGQRWANRLEIPLTPGGRVNRSMDEVRAWRPVVG